MCRQTKKCDNLIKVMAFKSWFAESMMWIRKMSSLQRISIISLSLRGCFGVLTLENIDSHPPCQEKSSLQDVLPTETPDCLCPLCMKYMCLLQLYAIHAALSGILPPPPPHAVNTPGSQSLRSLSHLPIMQASWRWSGGMRRESAGYELWDHPNRAVHRQPPHPHPKESDESEGKSCVALDCCNFPHPIWPPPPLRHILLASKNLCSLLARNHLRGLFQNCKSFFDFLSASNNAQEQAFLCLLKAAHCVFSVCRSLRGGRGEESKAIWGKACTRLPAVATRPWKSCEATVRDTLSAPMFTSPAAKGSYYCYTCTHHCMFHLEQCQ